MITLPALVKSKFLRLKRSSGKYLEIKHSKGYFFVYQSTSRWDKEKKRPVKMPVYFGRITSAGEFIAAKNKKPRNVGQPVVDAKEEIVHDEGQKRLDAPISAGKRHKNDEKLLMALSMNSRIPMSVLGRMVGLKETAVSRQVKRLERDYDIKHTLEIDTSKLGYSGFFITVKFLNDFPKIEELKEILSKESKIQLALLTKGDSDLVMYVLTIESGDINKLIFELRMKFKHESIWNAAPISDGYGFVPLRDEFIDILKDKLLTREYAVLKELNSNGNIDLTEIDKKYGFDKGRSQYSYHKLKEKGIIKRTTISMQKLPIRYIAIIFTDVINFEKFIKGRQKLLLNIIEQSERNYISKYLLVDDSVSPDTAILYLPVFNYGDLEAEVEKISNLDLGVRLRTMIATDTILGSLCFRNFDNSYSDQYKILSEKYNVEGLQRINYEETGRWKKSKRGRFLDIRGLESEPKVT
jgi:DNA-binding Lrp family transcriptional regulator